MSETLSRSARLPQTLFWNATLSPSHPVPAAFGHSLRIGTALVWLALIAWVSLPPETAEAAEIDSVTPRKLELADGVAAINAIINQRLGEGVANANVAPGDIKRVDSSAFCDEKRLYLELRKSIFQTSMPWWGLKGYELDLQMRDLLADYAYSLSLKDSIYRDIDYLEGFSLRLKELSDVVRVDGHLVGLDKIGHFFAEGWEYFERTHDESQTLDEAMEWGSRQEAGKFGYATTGIYSFADLTANFNGWRFWNEVRLTEDDPLAGPIAKLFSRPYVRCELQILSSLRHRRLVRSWEPGKRFDVSDYIDAAWDEGNNCNSYADPVIKAKVDRRIGEVDAESKCPLQPAECAEARRKYGRYAKRLLHPLCLTAGVD